jgi:uncharacterized membrane protein YeaQ/YmgE (transglycosylase-associated protein family)
MPLAVVVAVVVGILLFSLLISATFGLIGLALHLFMAGLVGALADAVVPGKLPWGWIGAILAGLIGSWLGVRILGHVGPSLFGIAVIPGFVGAVILAFLLSFVSKNRTASL